MKVLASLGMIVLAAACGLAHPVASTSFGPSPTTPVEASAVRTSAPPTPLPGGLPPARAGAALAYDPTSNRMILIGGMPDPLHPTQSAVQPGNDFWAWQPDSGWTEPTAEIVPPAGYMSSMAWDSKVKRLVLLTQSDTSMWTWDGSRWSPGAKAPSLAAWSGMAYDGGRGMLRLLGRSPDGGGEVMWSWDGSAWSSRTAPMSWREEAGVAYDEARGKVVVYGGFGDGSSGTWLFDGSSWMVVNAAAAPSAVQSSAAYDPARHQVVLHTAVGGTWTWDGANWSIVSTGGPGVRRDESMAYDPAIGKVVLFGGKVPQASGEVYMNDLWAWDGAQWSRLA